MSAVSSTEADRKLNIALHRMSPHIAEIMKDAIGVRVRPLSATIPAAKMEEDSGVTERLSQYVKTHRPESAMESIREEGTKPVLDPSLPIVDQCRSRFLQECGPHVLTGMFSPSWDIKHACILLLQDIVQYGNVSVHMKLSEFGCVKKLVDFLRVNTDDNLMEITGLIMVQILVSSDIRLKQVFNRHGGTRLLMAMSQFTSGEIKQEVTKTLKTVTRGKLFILLWYFRLSKNIQAYAGGLSLAYVHK
ncbi:hypothetical protein FSP39_019245 [Pinctada imbricata]|uniref:Uncharacterized protein n=1 Tax=Pinctada imbricata TaxID=66713 RepID=A0AA89BXV0_PINIB|nr:hypothetical protein FSP39_019245 [Pinctada imbricata]